MTSNNTTPAAAADRNQPVRILVVDDNPEILSGTARLLERAGYVVDQAACGAATPPAVQTHRPDLVLLDRDLPDLDGLEVCRRIKQSAAMADTFVIIISASYTASDEQAEGLESGADGYIARPIANRELLARVSSFVRIRRLTLSLRDQARQLQEQNESLQQQRAASVTLTAEAVAARDRAETELAARMQAEAEIERINRLYHALSHVNQAIVRVATRDELFAEMCRVLVEFAQLRLAWIGIVDEATQAVSVVARHGQSQEYVEHIRVFADERAEGRGPTGTAIREDCSIVVNDFMHDERTRLWQSAGAQAGIRASAAFPIHFQGRACGALTVYAGEPGFFQEREITLLEEAAADISFALEHLASEALRIKAEEALRRQQTMLMRTESFVHVGSWEWDVATDTVTWSDELYRIFQRNPAEGAPSFAEHPALYHPEDMQRLKHAVELAISKGTPYELTLRAIRTDGATRLCLACGHAEMVAGQKVTRLFGSFQDITEHSQMEAALRAGQQRHSAIIHTAMDGFWLLDTQGHLLEVNETYCTLSGYSAAELLTMCIGDVEANERRTETAAHITKVITQGADRFETRHCGKDGRLFDVEIRAQHWPHDGGRIVAFLRDITARKQIEEAIRAGTALQQMAGRAARLGGWSVTLPEYALLWSDEVAAIHDMPADYAPTVEEAIRFYAPEWQARIATVFGACIQAGQPFDEEMEIITGKGRRIWVRALGEAVRNAAGTIVKVQGAFQDISERKQTEAALRASHDLLHVVLNSIPVRVFWKDKNLVFLGCNTPFARDAGFAQPEDLIGKDDHAMGWREQAERYQADDRAVIASGAAKLLIEEPQTTPAGAQICLLTSKIPLRDAGGAIIGVLGTYFDITARKQAEALAQHEQALSATIIDSIPGAFYMLDEHGRYLRWNAYQRDEIVGQPDELTAGMSALETIHPDDRARIQSCITNVLEHGETQIVEGRVLLHGGPAYKWLLMTGCQLLLAGSPCLVGIGIDITTRKQAEEQMAQQLDELRRWHAVTLGREGRVGELKREVNALAARLGEPPPYGTQQGGTGGGVQGAGFSGSTVHGSTVGEQ